MILSLKDSASYWKNNFLSLKIRITVSKSSDANLVMNKKYITIHF